MMNNRQRLKQETQQLHLETESRWLHQNQFENESIYKEWLRALLTTHREIGLTAATIIDIDYLLHHEHNRLDALQADLAAPPITIQPDLTATVSWAWGVQYVLCGSALGAAVLLKTGGIQSGWPSGYLQRMQEFARSGELKQFFYTLDQQTLNTAEAIAGATLVFNQLQYNACRVPIRVATFSSAM